MALFTASRTSSRGILQQLRIYRPSGKMHISDD